jgi:hypothetical protein
MTRLYFSGLVKYKSETNLTSLKLHLISLHLYSGSVVLGTDVGVSN